MSIPNEPHYEIAATELAAWIEKQGADRWWNVDGDPLLTGRLMFPCPGDELAAELRRINRPLLVLDKHKSPDAKGQPITHEQLDALVGRLGENVQISEPLPSWVADRLFFLCWKGRADDWLLVEDEETTERIRADVAAGAGGK